MQMISDSLFSPIPKPGQSRLFVSFGLLKHYTGKEALTKILEMGYTFTIKLNEVEGETYWFAVVEEKQFTVDDFDSEYLLKDWEKLSLALYPDDIAVSCQHCAPKQLAAAA